MGNEKPQIVRVWLSESNSIEVPYGTNLRDALKGHFPKLYNGIAKHIHCRGMGTCGTCAVKIDGPVSPLTRMEKWRLNFPPHKQSIGAGLRLACQTHVYGDITIHKKSGLWGQK